MKELFENNTYCRSEKAKNNSIDVCGAGYPSSYNAFSNKWQRY